MFPKNGSHRIIKFLDRFPYTISPWGRIPLLGDDKGTESGAKLSLFRKGKAHYVIY